MASASINEINVSALMSGVIDLTFNDMDGTEFTESFELELPFPVVENWNPSQTVSILAGRFLVVNPAAFSEMELWVSIGRSNSNPNLRNTAYLNVRFVNYLVENLRIGFSLQVSADRFLF